MRGPEARAEALSVDAAAWQAGFNTDVLYPMRPDINVGLAD